MKSGYRRKATFVVGTLLVLLIPMSAFAAGRFTDVSDDNVFKADIEWLASAGVTKGCNPPANDEFCPEEVVTREQVAAFMHRLATNRVVDAATLEGRTASEVIARGAGAESGSSTSPIVLTDGTATELAAMTITVPADGGIVTVTTSATLDNWETGAESFVYVDLRVDTACDAGDPGRIAGTIADVSSVWYANVPLNGAAAVGEGDHTIRLCGTASQVLSATDETWSTGNRISATWSPMSMGPAVTLSSSRDSVADFLAKIEAARDRAAAEKNG